MKKYAIKEKTLTAIADAIRAITGEAVKYTPEQMAEKLKTNQGGKPLDALIDRSITQISNDRVTYIGNYAFRSCTALTIADFPLVTYIGNYAFNGCTALTIADFPLVTYIGNYAFNGCTALTTADFPLATGISNYAFGGCSKLTALILRNTEKVCVLGSTSAFTSTPIASGTGYIYVPAALVDGYKAATNWTRFAKQIRAIEDYPDICGEVTS